jgi:hypothetical protein
LQLRSGFQKAAVAHLQQQYHVIMFGTGLDHGSATMQDLPRFQYGPEVESPIQTIQWQDAGPVLKVESRLQETESKADKSKRKKHRKHHSRSHKKKRNRKHKVGAYILQLIGVLCLVLAALRSFEPLAGIGFTLVVIGYDGNRRERSSLSSKSKMPLADLANEDQALSAWFVDWRRERRVGLWKIRLT